MSRIAALALLSVLLPALLPARADVLLVDRTKREYAVATPARGMSMAQVERSFGVPQSRLDPRGGQKRQWPTINRWVYPAFTVYFERDKVIDVVLNQSAPSEIAPKPPVR